MSDDKTDVVIIGAGLSGIGAACHLVRNSPDTRYIILESRKSLGGTWDLFRYPGVRSDSDMHTLGYSFKPWRSKNTIADGHSILKYIYETAVEYGVDKHIRFGQRVSKAEWNSTRQHWTLTLRNTLGAKTFLKCIFINSCTGYYKYDEPYCPSFEGLEEFKGRFVPGSDMIAGEKTLNNGTTIDITLDRSSLEQVRSFAEVIKENMWIFYSAIFYSYLLLRL